MWTPGRPTGFSGATSAATRQGARDQGRRACRTPAVPSTLAGVRHAPRTPVVHPPISTDIPALLAANDGQTLRLRLAETDNIAEQGQPGINHAAENGHRNGFGIAFHPPGGWLWAGENTRDARSELNRVEGGVQGFEAELAP